MTTGPRDEDMRWVNQFLADAARSVTHDQATNQVDRMISSLSGNTTPHNHPPFKRNYEFHLYTLPHSDGSTLCSFSLQNPSLSLEESYLGTMFHTAQPGRRGGYVKTRGMNPSFYNASEFLEILETFGRTLETLEKSGILPVVSGLEQIASVLLSPKDRVITLGIDKYDPQNGQDIAVGDRMFSHHDIKKALISDPRSYLVTLGIDLNQ